MKMVLSSRWMISVLATQGFLIFKIDHSFVGRVNADPESTRILDCVLDLARKLSISIVAEGVETKEQLDYLNQNNITFQQGYYFYKPVTYIDLVKIILSKPKVKVVVE